MSMLLAADPLPLVEDQYGTIRVSNTRVTLESIIHTFQLEGSAELVQEEFPDVPLADIYAVISYYMHNQALVEQYFARQEAKGEAIRLKFETEFPPSPVVARLKAMLAERNLQL